MQYILFNINLHLDFVSFLIISQGGCKGRGALLLLSDHLTKKLITKLGIGSTYGPGCTSSCARGHFEAREHIYIISSIHCAVWFLLIFINILQWIQAGWMVTYILCCIRKLYVYFGARVTHRSHFMAILEACSLLHPKGLFMYFGPLVHPNGPFHGYIGPLCLNWIWIVIGCYMFLMGI